MPVAAWYRTDAFASVLGIICEACKRIPVKGVPVSTEAKRGDALQFIFSLFLGVLLVVVVGVGVWTFYQEPDLSDDPAQEQLDKLYREQERLNSKPGISGEVVLTPADTKRLDEMQEEIEDLQKEVQSKRDDWARTTSIILITFATVLMGVSLTLPEAMKVFSNGFLLGGMFTLIYGTGWSFAGGDSRARFYVVLFALLLSVGFGYLRFIRSRRDKEAAAMVAAGDGAGAPHAGAVEGTEPGALADLSKRVADLERRAAAAADALGARDE